MRSTFLENDVTLLLKDITGLVEPLPTAEREKQIQNGVHYCEMLPIEYSPTKEYFAQYYYALENFCGITAVAVKKVSEKIFAAKGKDTVIVSLARAGIPIGILIKRYLKNKYGVDLPHYAISIIRGMGIDDYAVRHILHLHDPKTLQFVDGWTGKGAIYKELKKEILNYKNVDDSLAVLSDPAAISDKCGTREDFLIASSCLNSTICGLISRTFYRKDIIGANEFHGAAFYGELTSKDHTYEFIDKIEAAFDYFDDEAGARKVKEEAGPREVKKEAGSCGVKEEAGDEAGSRKMKEVGDEAGLREVQKIAAHFGIGNINLIKPGVGETTRVLLRRVPDLVLIGETADKEQVRHIIRLAEEKNVTVEKYPLKNYNACGIIKNVAADI
ncbi:cysteine protease StiP family protein [Lachnospiraceae bacterium ZAX-1]